MYESYWRLHAKPFENHADPRFYYPSESHQGALLKLRYAIGQRRQAALLAGASGIGKTLLVDVLKRQLEQTVQPFVRLVFPQMSPAELLAYLAGELNNESALSAAAPTPPVESSVRRIQQALAKNAARGQHAVVVIDEAHLLRDPAVFETLRLLLNFEIDGRPPFTLLLVGQPGLLRSIERMPSLEERLGAKSLLRSFTPEETSGYVAHRLQATGATREVFDSSALDALHCLSLGLPRRVNRLADLALLVGFAEERSTISAEQIEAVHEDLVTVAAE